MKNKKKETQSRFIAYENLDKMGETAIYYGFLPEKSPSIIKADIDAAKDILEGDYIEDEGKENNHFSLHVEEKVALMRNYQERNMQTLPQPVMLYLKDPCKNAQKKNNSNRSAELEILGTSGSIAEATLIQASRAILEEQGYKNTLVEINSIGDKESVNRFVKELNDYYRKHVNDMSSEARQLLKKDPFLLLASHDPANKELNDKAPKSLDFLSEGSRRHLEELLEYFEALSIPYSVNNSLVGNRKYCTETIFSIVNADTTNKKQRILAIGLRYNGLAKRLNMKRDIQGVGISILAKCEKSDLKKAITKVKRPVASFVQLGTESKMLSLDIVEKLRRVKVPLHFSLAKDRLGAQVSTIEKYHTPYVIIMGKKEAVEKVAIVRKTDTHAQEIVSLADLPNYMKKLEGHFWKK